MRTRSLGSVGSLVALSAVVAALTVAGGLLVADTPSPVPLPSAGEASPHISLTDPTGAPLSSPRAYWTASTVPLGPPGAFTQSVLYVNQTAEEYTIVYPGYLVVSSATTGKTIARLNLGSYSSIFPPPMLAFDNATDEILVTGFSNTLFVISATTHSLVWSEPLPGPAVAMEFDATHATLWVLVGEAHEEGNGTYTVDGTVLLSDGAVSTYPNVHSIAGFWMGFLGDPSFFTGSMTVDTDRETVYVTGLEGFSGRAGIEWANLSSTSVQGSVSCVGGGPSAFDTSTDSIYVVDSGGWCNTIDEISVISGTTRNITATFAPVPGVPIRELEYDSASGELYDYSSMSQFEPSSDSALYLVVPSTGLVVARYPLPLVCGTTMSVDDWSGDAYLSDFCSDAVHVVNPRLDTGWLITAGGWGPNGVAFDPATGDIVIANELAGNVTVVSPKMHRVVATVGGIPEATAVVDDPETSEVYVVSQLGEVVAINSHNWTVSARLTIPNATFAWFGWSDVYAALDPLTNQVYVSSSNDGNESNISVISAASHEFVANVTVLGASYGSDPVTGLSFNPGDSAVWFATESGHVGRIDPLNFNITTVATNCSFAGPSCNVVSLGYNGDAHTMALGLDTLACEDTTWGSTCSYRGAIAGFNASSGTNTTYTPVGSSPIALLWDEPAHVLVSANSDDSNVSIVSGPTARVTDTLVVGDSPDALTNDPSRGLVYVTSWQSDNLSVLYPPPQYPATFSESGLPSETGWWVNVTGQAAAHSTTMSMTAYLPNGSYTYMVSTVDKMYQASGGTFTVRGAAVSASVTFVQVTYRVTFYESGLPSGTNWSVTANGVTSYSTTYSIVFTEPNGTYAFSVVPVSGYTVAPSARNLTVQGSSVSQVVTFSASSSGSSSGFLGLSGNAGYYFVGAIAVLVVGIAVALILRSRRR